MPNIYISSFGKEAYLGSKSVSQEKAFRAVESISPQAKFYLLMEKEKYKKALAMLVKGRVNLSDRVAGIPMFEYCFYGDYAPLMEYAVDSGYHNHYCRYSQYSSCYYVADKGSHVLHRVIKTSNLELVEKVLTLGGDPNGSCYSSDNTLLHNIGWFEYCHDYSLNSLELLKMLCEAGADVNRPKYRGDTPILAFAENVVLKQTTESEKSTFLM